MSSGRKISQDDLRKMMASAKANKVSSSSSANSAPPAFPASKRYKLGSREMALIEEQKKLQDEERRRKSSFAKATKLAPLPPPEMKPQKSILKNSTQSPVDHASLSHLRHQSPVVAHDGQHLPVAGDDKVAAAPTSSKDLEPHEPQKQPKDSQLPEGFFDDPVQDAKARNVPYVDAEEEEWAKFQKEIGEELQTAQVILVEDREEANADRQIEEIDEQMAAWSRVAKMEQKKAKLERAVKVESSESAGDQTSGKPAAIRKGVKQENSDGEDDEGCDQEFFDWRHKS